MRQPQRPDPSYIEPGLPWWTVPLVAVLCVIGFALVMSE